MATFRKPGGSNNGGGFSNLQEVDMEVVDLETNTPPSRHSQPKHRESSSSRKKISSSPAPEPPRTSSSSKTIPSTSPSSSGSSPSPSGKSPTSRYYSPTNSDDSSSDEDTKRYNEFINSPTGATKKGGAGSGTGNNKRRSLYDKKKKEKEEEVEEAEEEEEEDDDENYHSQSDHEDNDSSSTTSQEYEDSFEAFEEISSSPSFPPSSSSHPTSSSSSTNSNVKRVPPERNSRMRIDWLNYIVEDITVDSFLSIGNPFDHHVYRVVSLFRPREGEDLLEVVVYHRFSEFHSLHNKMISFPELAPQMPAPPMKSLIRYTLSEALISDRVVELNKWLKSVKAVRAVTQKQTYCEILYQFLINGEQVEGRITAAQQPEPATPSGYFLDMTRKLLEQGNYIVNKKVLQPKDSTPIDDYNRLSQKLHSWGEPPRMYPWKKYVVTIFGPTSAGKSSLVNHLFTLSCTRSGDSQIDIGYTIFETLPSVEFYQTVSVSGVATGTSHGAHHHKSSSSSSSSSSSRRRSSSSSSSTLNSNKKKTRWTDEELLAPLPESWEKVYTDERYGKVFVVNNDLERFRQQFSDRFPLIKQYNKIRSVFINEDFLRGSSEDIELAKKLIVIDSKGLDQTAKELLSVNSAEELEVKKVEIQLMQTLNLLSDKILFLVPYHGLHNCTEQLATFELSIVCSFDNGGLMEEKIAELREYQTEREEKERQQTLQTTAVGLGAQVLSYMLQPVIGLSLEAVRNLGSYVYSSIGGSIETKRRNRAAILGNEMWEKTRFVITKIDDFYDACGDDGVAELQLYYTLGRAFGNRKYIEAPTFDKFIPIGLPERRLKKKLSGGGTGGGLPNIRDKKVAGSLLQFKASLLREASTFSYEQRLDEAILSMCDQLEKLMKEHKSVLVNAERYWDDHVTAARKRAESRLQSHRITTTTTTTTTHHHLGGGIGGIGGVGM